MPALRGHQTDQSGRDADPEQGDGRRALRRHGCGRHTRKEPAHEAARGRHRAASGLTAPHPCGRHRLRQPNVAVRRGFARPAAMLIVASGAVAIRRSVMLEEFKKFVMRGNVVDLAVGVIIGVAFGAIVTSLVQDIIMPIIGAVTGGLDFSNYYLPLSSAVQKGASYADAKKQGAAVGYGQFITVALNFLIVSWVLFLV